MYDIRPLEEEWKKYQFKRKIPIFIGITFFSILVIIFTKNSNIVNFPKLRASLDNVLIVDSSVENNNKNILLKNNALNRLETEDSKESNNIDESLLIVKSGDILVDIPILNKISGSDIQINDKKSKKIYLDIIETSSLTAYKDVEKRFEQSHDIDDAIFLAKSYYKKNNYKKAEYWAFKVNKLDANIEESLLIFVKSKIMQGQINEGTLILKSYINKSGSEEAKNLLFKIENNKL